MLNARMGSQLSPLASMNHMTSPTPPSMLPYLRGETVS